MIENDFYRATLCPSAFSAPIILLAINSLRGSYPIEKIEKRALGFILRQRSDFWSFNYWDRRSAEAKRKPYPDDLDDTSCSLAALTLCDRNLVDGEALAKLTMILTSLEVASGGPYRTWLVDSAAPGIWRDVDLAVNTNVAYLLSLHEVALPALVELIAGAIDREEFHSPYYASAYPLTYFISRCCPPEKRQQLANYLWAKRGRDGSWGNPLNTALAISALLNLGAGAQEIEPSIQCLINAWLKDIGQPYAFYIGADMTEQSKRHFAGSAALTIAFFLEALHKYAISSSPKAKDKKQIPDLGDDICAGIVAAARKGFARTDRVLPQIALNYLDRFLVGDKDRQVLLAPFFMAQALGGPMPPKERRLVEKLGLASLYGWMAYTIYDDFLDDEGKLSELPVANFCLRESLALLAEFTLHNPSYRQLSQKIFDGIESANAWEAVNCRFAVRSGKINFDKPLPDYQDYHLLAQKSLGHALGPLAVLTARKKDAESNNFIVDFFAHYLIARQLNDDAHDWEEDLRRGYVNGVGALILSRWQKRAKNYQALFLGRHLNSLRKIFWHEVMPEVYDLIKQNSQKARQTLSRVRDIVYPAPFLVLLDAIDLAAEKTIREREMTLDFLKSYDAIDKRSR